MTTIDEYAAGVTRVARMLATGVGPREPILVLDHGYIQYIEHWGSDERIIEAARMSTGKGFLGWGPVCKKCGTHGEAPYCYNDEPHEPVPGDEKLLAYLYKNRHMTPFEMCGATLEVMAPIMVFREWHRHRTQSYNEMSARYMPLPDVNYVPSIERLMMGGGHLTKQAGTAKDAEALTPDMARMFQERIRSNYAQDEHDYQAGLHSGVPKELARLVVPVGRYSKMRASANLRNWMQFLSLRMESTAQWEIRQYANNACAILRSHFPRTIALFEESSHAQT